MVDFFVGQYVPRGVGWPGDTYRGGVPGEFQGGKIDVVLEQVIIQQFYGGPGCAEKIFRQADVGIAQVLRGQRQVNTALAAVGHVLRFVFGVELIVAGMIIPVGASVPFAMIAAGVAWMVWREVRDLS